MDALFAGIPGVCVYLDDILVSGKTKQEHDKNLDLVFSVLWDAGLKLKREKCLLAQDRVTYLGHIIDNKGLHPVKKKVDAIHKAPEPENVSELQSFIGLLCYYNKFLSNLSTVMAPLYELLRKDTPWKWGKEQSKAFKQCKTLLHCDSLLMHYDPSKQLVLACDAYTKGVGCVLSHLIDGVERPIAFYSRTLKPAEKNYSVLDKEALAVICGVKKFHCYLYGRSFIIQSDHKPLEKLLHEKNKLSHMAAPRNKRWSLDLSAYDYSWKYRSGKNMCHADAMSRLPLNNPERDEVPLPAKVVFLLQTLDYSPITSEQIRIMTRRDPVLSKILDYVTTGAWPTNCVDTNLSAYFNKQDEISIEQGCVLWGTRVIIPSRGRERVLELLHESHPGIVKMKSIARRVCWWPKLDSDIESYVHNCGNCQAITAVPPLSSVHPWEWPGKPWVRIHVDFAGPIKGQMYLIVIDSYSKWLEIIPTDSATAEVTIRALREIMSRWGLPLMMVSDNGPCFKAYEFVEFCKHNHIKHITVSPHHPASNGLAERAVQIFKRGVKKLSGNINENISHFLLYYRSTPQTTTGDSPSMLMLNRQIRTRVDIMLPHKHNNVLVKQQNMITGGKRSVSRSLYMGDPVRIINFSKHAKDKWLPGVVTDKHGPLTYLITLDDGRIFRRHLDHIRLRTNCMTNIGTPHPVVGVPNAIVSEDDHHPMIQLSDDSSEDPIPFPLDFDELATPSTDRSHEKPVLAPQHVQSSVTTAPHIQHQASGRSPTVSRATPPGTPNRFLQPMNTGSPTSLDTDQEPSTSVSRSTRLSDNGATGIRRSTRATRGQLPSRFKHYTAE